MKTSLLILLICLIPLLPGAIANEQPPKMNYLDSVIVHSEGLEKQFFQALQRQKNVEPLLSSLGIVKEKRSHPFGTVKYPGEKTQPMYYDSGEVAAINFRRKLAWHKDFKFGSKQRVVLIFDSMEKRWPGNQPITIVLADSEFTVIDWITSGGTPMFEGANLESSGKTYRLTIKSMNRNNTAVVDTFEIDEHKIKKAETDPP